MHPHSFKEYNEKMRLMQISGDRQVKESGEKHFLYSNSQLKSISTINKGKNRLNSYEVWNHVSRIFRTFLTYGWAAINVNEKSQLNNWSNYKLIEQTISFTY